MKPYIVIVHKDPDSAYGMSFPDAPGCFSGADDIDDLFCNAQEALELWLNAMSEEGGEIPRPRDLSELKQDPDWVESFAEAALVIALPPPSLNKRRAA
jgi:predicted RNase H-like HicB family nuclease